VIAALVWAMKHKLAGKFYGAARVLDDGIGLNPPGVCLVCGFGTEDEDADLCEGCLTPSNEAALQGIRDAGRRAWDEHHLATAQLAGEAGSWIAAHPELDLLEQQDRRQHP